MSDADILGTIGSWPMLCAPGGRVIWTRGVWVPDCRKVIRRWVREAGYDEIALDGTPEALGVGVAQTAHAPEPFRGGIRFFTFGSA